MSTENYASIEKLLQSNCDDTKSILICLKGSDLTGPGLMAEVSMLKKKIQAMENRNMKMIGGLVVIGFLIEQGVRFVFPNAIK